MIGDVRSPRNTRAQSLLLTLGALVRPSVNFYAHCRDFRRTVKNFRRIASNTLSASVLQKIKSTHQKERLGLCVPIWATNSSSIKDNENK